jgi:hypothetical protein
MALLSAGEGVLVNAAWSPIGSNLRARGIDFFQL